MAIFLTTASEKGGQAKTTTTANIGMMLALLGFRVLVLDCDPQGGLTFTFGIEQEDLRKTLYESLLAEVRETYDCPIQSVILQSWYNPETKGFVDPNQRVDQDDHTSPLLVDILKARGVKLVKGPHIAPISRASVRGDAELQSPIAPLAWTESLIEALAPVMNQYDYIVSDTNPSAGILTAVSLCASPYFYVPITPEQLSVKGAKHLFKTVMQTKRKANPSLQMAGILFTRVANYKGYEMMMTNLRTNLAADLGAQFPDLNFSFFETLIQQSKDGVDAANDRAVAVVHRPNTQHAMSYWFFLAELLAKIGGPANAVMPEVMRGIREYAAQKQEAAQLRKEAREVQATQE